MTDMLIELGTQQAIGFPEPLYEKYRPTKIESFVGQAKAKQLFEGLIERPRPCSILLVGPAGSGKTSMTMAFAEQLPGTLHHVSSQKLTVDAIDELADRMLYYPLRGQFHVVVADEADEMTEKAQLNLLSKMDSTQFLKPNFGGGVEKGTASNVIWIFTCNGHGPDRNQVPYSLVKRFTSRCLAVIKFGNTEPEEMLPFLDMVAMAEAGRHAPRFSLEGLSMREALMKLDRALLGVDVSEEGVKASPVNVDVVDDRQWRYIRESQPFDESGWDLRSVTKDGTRIFKRAEL